MAEAAAVRLWAPRVAGGGGSEALGGARGSWQRPAQEAESGLDAGLVFYRLSVIFAGV